MDAMDASMSSSDISGSSSFPSSSLSDDSSFSSSSSCRQFSLEDIKEATNNFDEERVLGKGGEGMVYLGKIYLEEGETQKTRVAVKRLNQSSTEFENEIRTAAKIQHPNLVALLGYCNESDEKILIYECMEKGTLSDYVKKDSTIILSWKQRLNICIGAASGLQHLHKKTDQFRKGIIHRDVKPANILIDENWVAKISDFGMFRLSDAAQFNSTIITKDIKGTRGYFAPEYAFSYQITRKIDVYAFGVVLFEVLCRKKPWDRGDESCYLEENEDLGVWAQQNVDAQIKAEISEDSLTAFTDIIGGSLRTEPHKRPTMDVVAKNLMTALECQESYGIRLQACGDAMIQPNLARLEAPKATDTSTYTWIITNFSDRKKEEMWSDVFTRSRYRWRLVLYPNGYKSSSKANRLLQYFKPTDKHLSLYLRMDGNHLIGNSFSFTLRIRNQLGGSDKSSSSDFKFFSAQSKRGFNDFMPLSDLADSTKGFLMNDTIILDARITSFRDIEDRVKEQRRIKANPFRDIEDRVKEQRRIKASSSSNPGQLVA